MNAERVDNLRQLSEAYEERADVARLMGDEYETMAVKVSGLGYDRFAELLRKAQALAQQTAHHADALTAEALALAEHEASKLE